MGNPASETLPTDPTPTVSESSPSPAIAHDPRTIFEMDMSREDLVAIGSQMAAALDNGATKIQCNFADGRKLTFHLLDDPK